jgi:hypothetical protein
LKVAQRGRVQRGGSVVLALIDCQVRREHPSTRTGKWILPVVKWPCFGKLFSRARIITQESANTAQQPA